MQDVELTTSLISNGADLLIFGMGTVFAFLTVLVFTTTLMSYVVQKFFSEPVKEPVQGKNPIKTGGSMSNVHPRTLAIIQDAIHQHRAKQN